MNTINKKTGQLNTAGITDFLEENFNDENMFDNDLSETLEDLDKALDNVLDEKTKQFII